MILQMAFRNLRRNYRRSLITALSVFAGAMLTGVAYGWVNGLLDLLVDGYIKYQTAHIRIVTEEYERRERFLPVDEIIPQSTTFSQSLKNIEGIERVEERTRFGILLGHEDSTVQAMGIGLDLKENNYKIDEHLREGAMTGSGIYIGIDLAKKLHVKMGDELLLATKTSEGGLGGIKLPVAGIFSMSVQEIDEKVFFLGLADAHRLLKLRENEGTEIYVYLDNIDDTQKVLGEIQKNLPAGLVARSYQEQMGGLYDYFESAKVIYVFIELLILFLASFVIINTMIMAIFERIREIGTLKAIGFTDSELFWMFTAEGGIIGILGGIPGAILGFTFIKILSYTGVNLETMMREVEMPIEYVVYPALHWSDIYIVVVMAILVPMLAAMIPARYVRRYQPAEALRM